ncbi:hypothetical protein BDU57DRAFT_542588 [Ampelomyces quisqualis]|uniref:Uncharacterized protein n=1 Tax=Ampelomyces quisqualis TaxID=50730 RepID=A0A6A5Q9F2_AMPQU|nr:hypothetical protein BDU57DRAFT_542588 [Ampelomyces quisqualis]
MADRKNKSGHGYRARDDGEWVQGMNEEEIAKDGHAGGVQEEHGNDMFEDQGRSESNEVTESEDSFIADVTGRNDTNPKRARDEGEAEAEAEAADIDAKPSEKRRKTRSEPGFIEKPSLEKNNGYDAARPQYTETENEKNRKKSLDFLHGIRANWDFQLNDLVNQAPDHLLEKAITKDELVDVKSMAQLYDLSKTTRGQWRGEYGVQAELTKSLAQVTRHSKGVFEKAINEVRAVFAARKSSTNGTGQGGQGSEFAAKGSSGNVHAPSTVRNNDASPTDVARRQQLVELITEAWGMPPQQVIPRDVLRNFKNPDPLKWDTYALTRLWELAVRKASGTYVSGLQKQLEIGYFKRLKGFVVTKELTAEDVYYAYNGGESREPFDALELPELVGSPIIVYNASETCPDGPSDDHLSRRATHEPRSDRSTSGPRSARPSNEPRADSTPRQPPNASEPSPSSQPNESPVVQSQRTLGTRRGRRTPRIEREIVLAGHDLRIALREQRLAEANVEVAKARYQEVLMAGHKLVGMDTIVAAEAAVTDAKGKVDDANTKLIEWREKLDKLQSEKEGLRVAEQE